MKLLRRLLPLAVVLALIIPPLASAQTIGGAPNTIDYQGKALDAAGNVLAPTTATNYQMTFRIYDAQEGGTVIWAETQIVTVKAGLFSVRLGEGTTNGEGTVLQTNLADAFTAAARFLGVTILISGQTPAEILPRLAFLATPFAYSANRSITAERLVLNTSATAVPSAVNANAVSYATQTLTTGDYTLNDQNHTVLGDTTSGWVNITLPAVTTRREYYIIKTSANQNPVNISAPAGGTICGTSAYWLVASTWDFSASGGTGGGSKIKLKVRGEAVLIQNTGGNNWWVVSDTRDKTPVGTIIAIGGNTYGGWPAGYYYCNGASLSRTDIRWEDLFAVIGTNHGTASATMFNVPDLRGKFLRAVDDGVNHDDQRNARVAHYLGGASGDAPGSFQWWATGTHTHTFSGTTSTTTSAGSHDHMNREYTLRDGVSDHPRMGSYGLLRRTMNGEGWTSASTDTGGSGSEPDIINQPAAIPIDGAHTHTVVPNGTIGATGGASSNPTNISVYYFIKY